MTVTGEPDYERLEQYFRALAYSNRLELLHQLRFPRHVTEIRLTPRQVREGENPDRVISRQAVQEHLDKLAEIGVVVARDGDGLRARREYQVNGLRLYQIMEEFRQVGTIVTGAPSERDATVDLASAPQVEQAKGPRLVLVHGLLEGKVFPLSEGDLKGGRGWVIGRKPELQVGLDYDPFVSLENSEIMMDGDAFVLEDLRSSRNGTWVNWRRLERGGRHVLSSGDVIGAGRSLLVFRRE